MATASPAEMAMAVVRLLAIAACVYLLAVTALGVAARLVRARGLSAAVDRISPRSCGVWCPAAPARAW